jgi:hypothetical protein
MTTVHVRNTIRDFETWKTNFDKYARFRAENGVQSYRVSRGISEPNAVIVDLEFLDDASAQAFLPKLAQIMASPQANEQVARHEQPQLYALVTDAVPAT